MSSTGDSPPNTADCCRGSRWIGNVIKWNLTPDLKEDCTYTIVVEKNCCPAVKSKPSTVAVRDFKGKLSAAKASSFPPLQTYTSFGNVSVNLNYTCPEGCPATYTWSRQHKAANGQFVNVVNGGGSGSSPLSIPVPQNGTDRIVISVKCGYPPAIQQ